MAERAHRKVLLVSINYRGAGHTLELLDSLRRLQQFSEVDVVIVDNASGDDSALCIRAKIDRLENVQLLESQINRGYFGGAKWGVRTYTGKQGITTDWIIVCNNDCIVKDNLFLERLLAHDPWAVGVIAPRVQSLATHLDQNPFMETRPDRKRVASLRFWTSTYYTALLRELLSSRVGHFRHRLRKLKRRDKGDLRNGERRQIYAPQGSFIIFSRRYFTSGGYLDDGCFLYGEEISVGEICHRLGLAVIYDPQLRVLHSEHQTTGGSLSRFTYNCQKQAVEYLYSKYLADVS